MFSPACFGRYYGHLQGDVVKRTQSSKCDEMCRRHSVIKIVIVFNCWTPWIKYVINIKVYFSAIYYSLNPFTPCGAQGIHEELPSIAVSSYSLDLVPWSFVLLISSSIVLRHVLFGLPLLLYPWGFQSNAVFSIVPVSLRNVCPIQFHFLLFIWFSIDFCWVILHSSSFVIL